MATNSIQNGESLCTDTNEIAIRWENLQYNVIEFTRSSLRKKSILSGLNGHFMCGSLDALIGPSGAGKTSLLKCLSESKHTGLGEHSKIYANIPAQSNALSCFIEQLVHKSMLDRMSVRSILYYAIRFKNSTSNTNRATMAQHIDKIMRQLMLQRDLLDQYFEECSGGQQKRILIAQELMSFCMPLFLFVDEPTTGLDSVSAFEVINCLKQLTLNSRITVIASIHAPNNDTLNLFDQIYVLAKGGVAIYTGPSSNIESYLKREIQLNIPARQPPIEALIKIACNGTNDPNVIKLVDKCSTYELDQLSTASQKAKVSTKLNPNGMPKFTKRFSLTDLFYSFNRQFHITFIANLNSFLFTNVLLAFLIWFNSTFFDKKMAIPSGCISLIHDANSTANCSDELNESSLMRENITYFWFAFMFAGYFTTCLSALFASPFVKMFQNEHRNNWYSLGVFYLSITLVSLLETTFQSAIMVLFSYFGAYQHAIDDYEMNWYRFGWYFSIFWLNNIYMQSLGQLVGTIFVNYVENSILISIVIASTISMFNPLFYDLDKSHNFLLIKIADLIGAKFLVHALIYTLYDIGRCDEKTISNNLITFHVNRDKIVQNLFLVCFNIIVLRLASFLFMYVKFCKPFQNNPFVGIFLNWQASSENCDQIISLSRYNENCCKIQTFDSKLQSCDETLRHKIILQWRNLSLFKNNSIYDHFIANSASNHLAKNTILDNLNGQLRIGTITALMGTSGSGKTSLLKVLNGQYKTRLSADTCFYLSKFVAIKSCFIAQNVSQHLMPGLTAKELLTHSSRIKNASLSRIDHSAKAMSLLEQLDMIEIGDTKVDNCSGGERKRLAIAQELVSDRMPNLILIDEPTSGLDSNTAEMVILCLKKLCTNHNITIVCSIHQPTAHILAMLDQLYVLSLKGVCVYSGAPYQIESHLSKIAEIGHVDCRFAIEILIKHSCMSATQGGIVHKLEKLNRIQFNSKNEHEVRLIQDGVMRNRSRFMLFPVGLLMHRYASYIWGIHWRVELFTILQYLIFCVNLRLIFDSKIAEPSGCINLEDDFSETCARTTDNLLNAEILMDNYKYCFLMSSAFFFIMMLQTSLTIKQDLVYFWAEHQNGWYSSGVFYLSTRIREIAFVLPIIMSLVYICNIYETISPGIYWHFVLILLLASLAIQALAHICALLSKGNYIIMTVMTIIILVMFMLLSNTFIYLHKLHYIYRFVANFSVLRFTFEAFLLLIYGFGRCGQNEIQLFLYLIQIQDADYYHCVIMLIVNAVIWQIVAILLLVHVANPAQHRRQRIERITNYCNKLEPTNSIVPGLCSQQFVKDTP